MLNRVVVLEGPVFEACRDWSSGSLAGCLAHVPRSCESVVKYVVPYRRRRGRVVKYVGPYRGRRRSVVKYVGPYRRRRESVVSRKNVGLSIPWECPQIEFQTDIPGVPPTTARK